MATVDEQDTSRLEGMPQYLDPSRQHRFPSFKPRDRAATDARGVCKVLERPVQRRPRHAALGDVQSGTLRAKSTCVAFGSVALTVP